MLQENQLNEPLLSQTATPLFRSPTLIVKNYILDTNVLLHDPNSLLNFADNHVMVPIEVIEEIDRFKRESTELGRNARMVSRMLDGFRRRQDCPSRVSICLWHEA